ncbi:enoyl-CoA hydratase/isomerase family protein [Alteromonas sp. C1M14]|uniref:enoyl-CoA hydratase/isomerase family protein n=1 Tax=Alteromonas sp. C1M14 TaxID=2841567 RepID=UPI001C0951F0|nr:enoyl-CoA hydratase/isomerase family protein [Alteromonas sp. C1M14]MBU2976947.1 enoyl-CoA hydratase/isomerase family protein [Alteromonas sp. C1M14]
MESQSTPKIIISEHETACGKRFGQLTLNNPSSLNALDLDMAVIMSDTLKRWQTREEMLFVVIDSVGGKAFCAGGDIVSMYKAMSDQVSGTPKFIEQFFSVEYELDYLLHTYPMPVVVWGQGIVMGGGMGIFAGGSHRVTTETTRIAMPEITIGLFPDVGGSYFLPRLPDNVGLFLGLTAAQLNGWEAQSLGLADFVCASDSITPLLRQWQDARWSKDVAVQISQSLHDCCGVPTSAKNRVAPWRSLINKACNGDSIVEVANGILAIDAGDCEWMVRAQSTLAAGSPLTANVFFKQYHIGKQLPLHACFQMELDLACRSSVYGELQEGIRALLIEKDKSPKWRFSAIDKVPDEVISHFFTSPWSTSAHPLAHLG